MGAGQCGYAVGPLQEMLVVQRSRYHDLLSQALQPLVDSIAKTEPWPPQDVTTEAQAGERPSAHFFCRLSSHAGTPPGAADDCASIHEVQASQEEQSAVVK